MDTRHLIEELVFEFNFDSLPDARTFEEELSGWLRHSVLPPFESLLDGLSGAGELLRFDTLEIDLGNIEVANFRHELQARLLTRLRAALEEKIGQLRHDAYGIGAIARREETQAELQQILSFLTDGSLSWQASGDPATAHERLLERVIKADGRLLFREIGRSARRKTMLARLSRQFPRQILLQLLRTDLGLDGRLLKELSEAIQGLAATTVGGGAEVESTVLLWECLLECVWEGAGLGEDELATKALSAYLNAGGEASRTQIAMLATAAPNGRSSTPELSRLLKMALYPSGERAGGVIQTSEMPAGAAPLPQAQEAVQQYSENIGQGEAWLAETSRLLRQGVLKAGNLKLDTRQMSRLLAYFIAHDEQAGIGNRLAFVQAIESHLALQLESQSVTHAGSRTAALPDPQAFYALVIQRLVDRELVDLEAITKESSGVGALSRPRTGVADGSPAVAGTFDQSRTNAAQGTASAQTNGTMLPPVDSPTPAAPDPAEQLRFRLADYLLHGDAEQLAAVWHVLYRRYAAMTRDALRHYGRFDRVRGQFVDNFPAAMLKEFVELIEPEAAPVFSWIGDQAPALAIDEFDIDAWRRGSWRAIFDLLLADGAVPFDLPRFVEAVVRQATERIANTGQYAPQHALRQVIEIWSDALDVDAPEVVRRVLRDLGTKSGLSIIARERDADQVGDEILANIRRLLLPSAPDQRVGRPADAVAQTSAPPRDIASHEQSADRPGEKRMLSSAIDLLLARYPSSIRELFAMQSRGEFSWRSIELRSEQLLHLLQFRERLAIAPVPGHHGTVNGSNSMSLAEIEHRAAGMQNPVAFFYAVLDGQDKNETSVPPDSSMAMQIEGDLAQQTLALEKIGASASDALPVAPTNLSGGESIQLEKSRELAQVWQRILRGEPVLATLSWSTADLKRLTATAVAWHASRDINAPMQMLRVIDEYAARSPQQEYFYSIVLDHLAQDIPLDLDAILASSQPTSPPIDAAIAKENVLPPGKARVEIAPGRAAKHQHDPAAPTSTGETAALETSTIWQRMRRAEIHALDLGWEKGKLRNLIAVALDSAASAPTMQAVMSAALPAHDLPGSHVHPIAKSTPDGGLEPVGDSSHGPGTEAGNPFLAAIDEHALRARNPGTYYRNVLEELAAGRPIDLERALERGNMSEGDEMQIGVPFPKPSTTQDASGGELELALHSASKQQGERLRVAFLPLQDKLAGAIEALTDSELIFLIDRYLEIVAGSDTGNRKMFFGAVSDHAASSAGSKRYLRLVLARLLRRETVDLEELQRQAASQAASTKAPARNINASELHETNEEDSWRRVGNAAEAVDSKDRQNTDLPDSWQPHAATDERYLARHDAEAMQALSGKEAAMTTQEPTQQLTPASMHDGASAARVENVVIPSVWRERIQAEIARQSPGAVERQAAFLHAIEHHAQLSSDLAQYYRLVLAALEQNRVVDLESIVAESDRIAVQEVRLPHSIHGDTDRLQGADARITDGARGSAEHRGTKAGSLRDRAVTEAGVHTDSASSVGVTASTWMAQLQRTIADGSLPGVSALIRRLTVEKDPASAGQMLACLGDANFNDKLVTLLPADDLRLLLVALVGPAGAPAARYANAAAEAVYFLSEGLSWPQAFRFAWRASLDYFFVQRGTFGGKAFPTMLTARLARELGMRSTRALRELIDVGVTADTQASLAPDVDQGRADSANAQVVHTSTQALQGRMSGADGTRTAKPGQPLSGRRAGADSSAAEEAETQSNIDVHVDNAGLVLAWPYLPRLFGILNLMEKNTFVSREAAERAVHLLQFMVTGQSKTPEYALVLNKQLCGIATGLPIVAGIEIIDQEKEIIENLIRGMIQNWKAIGNTSIDGFRQSFLQRQGWMSLQEEVWHLRVQTRAFDMLLDQLPWGISMVKHAWMTRPIHVKWR